MTSKNQKPLTQPEPGDPNHGKFCAQPGSLHTTDIPMQPSLKEQMQQGEPEPAPFDHKACILCDRVIVQKILGNKCGQSGSLCCNLKECPIEARKRREMAPVPAVKEEIPCCENCPKHSVKAHPIRSGDINLCDSVRVDDLMPMTTRSRGCLSHPGARAYLNKDVIAELESWINGLEYPDCPPGDAYTRVIALLKECGQE